MSIYFSDKPSIINVNVAEVLYDARKHYERNPIAGKTTREAVEYWIYNVLQEAFDSEIDYAFED